MMTAMTLSDKTLSDKALSVFAAAAYHQRQNGQKVARRRRGRT